MFALTDLTTPLTRDQAKESIYKVLAIVGVNTTSWKPGAVVRTMIAAVAVVLAAFSQLLAAIAQSGFLELSSGAWLDLVAYYVYGQVRPPATYAAGNVTLVNTGGGIYTLDAGDLIVSNPATGKTYRNTASFTLNALATLSVAVVATEAGSASTSNPGRITKLETTLLGVTCTNPTAFVGTDAATDAELKTLCSEKLGVLSPNGPWDAYSYTAKFIAKRADGTPIGVTRVRSTKDGYGNVYVYCATASGGVAGDENDPATDLGAIADAIRKNAEPLSVTSHVVSAKAKTIPLTGSVALYNTHGLTEAQLTDLIAKRVAAFFAVQPVGGNVLFTSAGAVFQDAIKTVVGSSMPQIFHVALSSPATDTYLTADEIPVLGTVALSYSNVAPPEGLLI